MLSKRIIPCLDVRGGRVVKGVRFRDHVDMGDITALAQQYRDQGADELVFYDIGASPGGRAVACDWVERVSALLDIPFCVAGGIRDVATARAVLHAGADKVSLNSAAVRDPSLISQAAAAFGNQAVVVAIDAKRVGLPGASGADKWEVFTAGGRNATGIDAVAWAEEAARRGAGEILLTSMDRDGTKAGFDLGVTRAISDAVTLPVIASGGVGNLDHLVDGVLKGGADAVLAASIFHFGEFTIPEAKRYMAERGIEMRL